MAWICNVGEGGAPLSGEQNIVSSAVSGVCLRLCAFPVACLRLQTGGRKILVEEFVVWEGSPMAMRAFPERKLETK